MGISISIDMFVFPIKAFLMFTYQARDEEFASIETPRANTGQCERKIIHISEINRSELRIVGGTGGTPPAPNGRQCEWISLLKDNNSEANQFLGYKYLSIYYLRLF